MIKNMDNMHLAAETMQNTSKNIESSIQEIKRTGVFEKASKLIRVARENEWYERNKHCSKGNPGINHSASQRIEKYLRVILV
jgi:hypothetical protein